MRLGDEGTKAAGRVVAPREEGTGVSRAARRPVRRGRPGGAGADRAQRGQAAGAPSGQGPPGATPREDRSSEPGEMDLCNVGEETR